MLLEINLIIKGLNTEPLVIYAQENRHNFCIELVERMNNSSALNLKCAFIAVEECSSTSVDKILN